jgi:hypothetical protein
MMQPIVRIAKLPSQPARLLWIVNHKTLLPAEVPILHELGWEVFVPKIVPDHDLHYRSAAATHEYDMSLTISPTALAVLNGQNFYERDWSPTVTGIINQNFQVVVATFSFYVTPLSEAARKFRGIVVARVFGREHPARYSDLPRVTRRPSLLQELAAIGNRFVFGQGYETLAEIEEEPLRSHAHTLTVPLPAHVFQHQGTWRGGGSDATFLCPGVTDGGYYQAIYERDKRDFGDLPHVFFGRQLGPVNDPAVLPYLTDSALLDLYAATPVFVYPSTEPRHVHYSPLEAMVVGAPVLYRRGALIDTLGTNLPGACTDTAEMREKALRLLAGDRVLADTIRATQGRVLSTFDAKLARQQWAAVLADATVSAKATA